MENHEQLNSAIQQLKQELTEIVTSGHEHGIKDTPGLEERLDVIEKDLISLRSDHAKLTALIVQLQVTAQIQDRQITALENPHNCIGC